MVTSIQPVNTSNSYIQKPVLARQSFASVPLEKDKIQIGNVQLGKKEAVSVGVGATSLLALLFTRAKLGKT